MSGDKQDPKFEPGQDPTFQMDPTEVAKLHAMLGKSPSPDRPIQRTLNYMDGAKLRSDLEAANPLRQKAAEAAPAEAAPAEAAPAKAPAPREAVVEAAAAAAVVPKSAVNRPEVAAAAPIAPARKPGPSTAQPSAAGSSRAPLIGIGAVLAIASFVMMVLPMFQGNQGMAELAFTIGPGLMAVGYLLMAIGIPSTRGVTGAMAPVAAAFAFLTACVGATALVVVAGRLGGLDIIAIMVIALMLSPALTWLMIGLWGLASGKSVGALGSIWGLAGLVGGAALLVGNLLPILEMARRDDDLIILLSLGGMALCVISACALAAASFGKLKSN